MEVMTALQARRSIRKFTDEQVSREAVDTLLHAAMSGPSACNVRPWEFYVIRDAAVLDKLHGASRFTNIDAPLAIVVCGEQTRTSSKHLAAYWVQDCSAATENILLAAVDIDLGAVWCGVYPQEGAEKCVREALKLPETQIPLNIIYIGHPAESHRPRDQYNEEYVHYV